MMVVFTAISMKAQIATENSKLSDNIYVTVSGGVETPLDFNKPFPVNPLATIAVGKELTPVFGFEVEGTAWFGSHTGGTHKFGVPRFDNESSHNFIRSSYVGLNGAVNLSNLIFGYKGEPRFFEVKTITGIGWIHMFSPKESNSADNHLGAKTGLDFVFNFGSNKAHAFSVKPAVLWNLSVPGQDNGNNAFNKNGAQLAINVGYTYYFPKRHLKTYDVGSMESLIYARESTIERLNEELAKKPKEVTVYKDREVINYVDVSETYVFFDFDSAELTDDAKAKLDKVAQNGVYNIDGYASVEGSKEYNLELSQRRAESVKKYLDARGCKINKAIGRGVAFGTTTGRVAIVSLNK